MKKSIISQIKENPKKCWQYAQAKMKTRTGIPNLIKSDSKDDLTNSDSEKAELLANYFSSVFTREYSWGTYKMLWYSWNMYY